MTKALLFTLLAGGMAVSVAYAGAGLSSQTNGNCTAPSGVNVAPFDDASGPTTTTTTLPVCNTPDQSFVIAAYTDFLGRAPTPSELTTGTTELSSGTPRASFVLDLANSPEWVTAIVNKLYEDTLGRPGDSGGVTFWTNQIRTGAKTVAQVSAEFYASSEYFNGIGGGTNTSWVTDLYSKLLHRTPDTSGLNYWVGQAVTAGRFSVAYRFFQSNESAIDRVTALYETLLGRAPDPGGAAFWAARVVTQGDIALAVNLASSNEYYTRAAVRFPD